MGRPQLLHDDDIDQDFPDSVNDEDIGPSGLLSVEDPEDCHVDALIFHAKYVSLVISRSPLSLLAVLTFNQDRPHHRSHITTSVLSG